MRRSRLFLTLAQVLLAGCATPPIPITPPDAKPAAVPATAEPGAGARLRVPTGFKAAPGTQAEPYTQTGWAREIVHEATGMPLVYVPEGEFFMGSPEDETGREDDEVRHRVTLTQGFYLGKYEVTQGQWQGVMKHNPSGFAKAGPAAPVENVSWAAGQAFIAELNAAPPKPLTPAFRLPTEAEWEYACRAGTTTALNNGANLNAATGRCWSLETLGWVYREHGANGPHPVGQKTPNAWGLYDMHGNVAEWCADWYGPYPWRATLNPAGLKTGDRRVFRGGSWANVARGCRAASRFSGPPDPTGGDLILGCRLAVSADARSGVLGWTPLHVAAREGHADALRRLLAAGEAVNARDKDGGTPLHSAAWNGQTEALRLLLAAGAAAKAQDKAGGTPLHGAAWHGQVEAIRLLLSAGADANASARYPPTGTPLHFAAVNDQVEAVRALLAGGADPNARNPGGQTVRDGAVSDACRELLRQAGGKTRAEQDAEHRARLGIPATPPAPNL